MNHTQATATGQWGLSKYGRFSRTSLGALCGLQQLRAQSLLRLVLLRQIS
jgi:hypothetical protein